MQEPYWGLMAPKSVVLDNGKILCWGRQDESYSRNYTYHLYNPKSRSFWTCGMGKPTAALLPSGDVLINDSLKAHLTANNEDLCDLLVNKYDLKVPRDNFTTVLLPNKLILVIGGCHYYQGNKSTTSLPAPPTQWLNYLPVVEIYDPLTRKSRLTDSMKTARFKFSATMLGNDKVLIAGGRRAGGAVPGEKAQLESTELYDIKRAVFEQGPKLHSGRFSHTATLLKDGKVFVSGGYLLTESTTSTEIYEPTKNQFMTGPSLQVPRAHHSATLLENGEVLILGGDDEHGMDNSGLTSVEIFEALASRFTSLKPLQQPRQFHNARIVADHTVLIFGGENHHPSYMFGFLGESDAVPLKTAELYAVKHPAHE